MKWKLTQSEFNALFSIIETVLFGAWSEEIYDKLLKTVFTKTYVRMYKMKVHSQSKYSLKIPSEECLTIHECLSIHDLPLQSFEGNLLNKIIADIDKNFAINASIEIFEQKDYKNKI